MTVDLSKLSDVLQNDVIKKTDYNAKITEIESKIPNINNLATEASLNTVENKIPDTRGLVKKTDYNAKITDLENKIPDISNLATKTALNTAENKIPNGSGLASKIALTAIENKIPDNSLLPSINYISNTDKIRVKFTVTCLKQLNKLTYTHKKVVNIYIVYELDASSSNLNDPTLKNCLFSAVTLTKNADIDKYGYSGYGIGFDRRGSFSFPGGGFGQNVLIFGVDMSSSAHIDNKKKNILVLGIGPTQGLEHTLTAEKMYSINFTITNKKVRLSLNYNGVNS